MNGINSGNPVPNFPEEPIHGTSLPPPKSNEDMGYQIDRARRFKRDLYDKKEGLSKEDITKVLKDQYEKDLGYLSDHYFLGSMAYKFARADLDKEYESLIQEFGVESEWDKE